jgi:hypothetical protein
MGGCQKRYKFQVALPDQGGSLLLRVDLYRYNENVKMPNAEERINVFNMGSWQLKKQKPDIS